MSALEWQVYVQLDLSGCSLTYGTAPCTASVPTTGTQKCFNTVGSCQDRANYAESIFTLTFCKDVGYQAESGIEAIPCLIDADLTPGRIAPGEGLGQRPSMSLTFRDMPHSDTGTGFDKYLSTRGYNPFEQGTLWGKIAKRHPNMRGKKVRVIQGWKGQSLSEMETRHYIIDSVDGPSLDGTFTITAKDPLKSLDGERAQAPAVNSGYLNADITSSATSAILAPGGIGNAEYAASGYLNIGGKEIVSFTRSTNTLTITRAQKNTTAVAHKANDRVQECLVYSAQDPANIIYDLLVTYGGIDASYIPLADWLSETSAYNGQVYTGFIPDPTPVKDLVAEIIEQAGLQVWWDDVGQKIRLQVLRSISTDAVTYDESMYREGSLRVTAQPDKRKSQIWTYFAQRNPLEGLDLTNLPGGTVLVDTDSEADYGSPLTKVIKSRWIPEGGRDIADRLNEIQLGRYLTPPREVEFELVVTEDMTLPVLGGGYRLSAPSIQDVDGSRVDLPFTVTRLKVKDGVCRITGEELNWTDLQASDPLNRIITIDYDTYNLNWRTLHDNLYGTPTPKGRVTLIIASNASIGSTSTSTFALETGTWPSQSFTATRSTSNGILTGISDTSAFAVGQAITGSGIPNHARILSIVTNTSVTIDKTPTISGSASLTLWDVILDLVDEGRISGKGGKGGNGSANDNFTGYAGEAGGTALHATAPVNLSGAGKLYGGGGGGGAGGSDYLGWFGPQVYGAPGGGGAGVQPGNGGNPNGTPAGNPGTPDAGGAFVYSYANGTPQANYYSGPGGSPGQPGGTGAGYPGAGGAAGKSTDGAALLKTTAFTGSILGPTIN